MHMTPEMYEFLLITAVMFAGASVAMLLAYVLCNWVERNEERPMAVYKHPRTERPMTKDEEFEEAGRRG